MKKHRKKGQRLCLKLKKGHHIAIFQDTMIEIAEKEKQKAYIKAKKYFEYKENRKLLDEELTICQIPDCIGVLID